MDRQQRTQITAFCILVLLICLAGPLLGLLKTFHIDSSVLEIVIGLAAVITAILFVCRQPIGSFFMLLREKMRRTEDDVIEYPALPGGERLLDYDGAETDYLETSAQGVEQEPEDVGPTLALASNIALPFTSALNHTLIYEQPGVGRHDRSVATRLYIEQLAQYSVCMLIVTRNNSYSSLVPLFPNGWIAGSPESKDTYLARAAHFMQYNASTPAGPRRGYGTVTEQNAHAFGKKMLELGAQVVFDLSTYADLDQAARILRDVLLGLRAQNAAHKSPGIVFLVEAEQWLPNTMLLSRGYSIAKDARLVANVREQINLLTASEQDTGLYAYLTTNTLMSMDLRPIRQCSLWLLNKPMDEEDVPFVCYSTGLAQQDFACLQAHTILADVTSQTAMETVLNTQRSIHQVETGTGRDTTEPLTNASDLTHVGIGMEEASLGKLEAEDDIGEHVEREEEPSSASRKPFTRQQIAFAVALQREGQLSQTALKRAPTTKTVGGTQTTFADLAQELGLKQPWSDKDILWNERAKLLLELVLSLTQNERNEYEQEADVALAAIAERRGYLDDANSHRLGTPPSRWELPDIGLLKAPEVLKMDAWTEVAAKARLLQETLNGFGVAVQVLEEYIKVGPRVIRFGILPTGIGEKRTKVEHITRLRKDLQRVLQAKTIRILDPVPGTPYVGIEIPNPVPSIVRLRDVLEDRDFMIARSKSKLTIAVGKDVAGKVRFFDLRKAPHVLIGGTTGSGKSVCVNTILVSLLMGATPEDVRLALVDPKKVELPFYNKIPHLLGPVITKMDDVAPMLQYAIAEMNRRYDVFAQMGVRDLDEYNKRRAKDVSLKNIPAHVILIDELASIMLAVKDGVPVKDLVEPLLCDLIALGRAAGVHLILATQRPVVDVVTGNIKAQLPTRIGFMVPQANDSRIILDQSGAETLLGKGDLLFLNEDIAVADRMQCALTETEEAQAVTDYWKHAQPLTSDSGVTNIDFQNMQQMPLPEHPWGTTNEDRSLSDQAPVDEHEAEDERDPLLDDAIAFVRAKGSASTSMVQRHFRIGYSRAATLIEQMEAAGIIGEPAKGGQRREVRGIPENEATVEDEALVVEAGSVVSEQEQDPVTQR